MAATTTGNPMKTTKSIFSRLLAPAAAALLAVFAAACATPQVLPVPAPELSCLRVGFAANYPPLCTTDEEGRPAGLEADFAAALADELGCPLEIVPLDFGDLFPALLDGRVDILMSGLTVTPSRAYKMRFCKPYLSNPLVAATRPGWGRSYASASHVLSSANSIGVLRHTYAETFVNRHAPRARIVIVTDYDNVPGDLAANHYSIYVDDLAALLDLSSNHKGLLEIIPYPLQQQDMAWAVRPDSDALLSAANAALDKWKANGRLDAMLDHWLPGRSW